MGKPYSGDLRERVVAAIKTGGLSCNRAAKQFGIAASTAINWMRRQRETGSVAPGKIGGYRPKSISGGLSLRADHVGQFSHMGPCECVAGTLD